MPNTLNVARADLIVESAYAQPEFGLFRDTAALFRRLYEQLQPHALQLQNMKLERGSGNLADFHVACHMYNFRAGVTVHAEKAGISWVNLLDNEIEVFNSLFLCALAAIKEHQPTVVFRSHTMTLGLHGALEGKSVNDYLSTFVRNVPEGLGPHTGNGGVMYFGPSGDRLLSTITVDLSAVVPSGLFVRPHIVWDGSKIEVAALPASAMAFLRQALGAFGLEIHSLRS